MTIGLCLSVSPSTTTTVLLAMTCVRVSFPTNQPTPPLPTVVVVQLMMCPQQPETRGLRRHPHVVVPVADM